MISAFFRLLVLTSGNDAVSAGIGGAHYFGVVGKVGAPHSLSRGAPLAGTLLTAWQNSEYRQAAFRSYVSSRYGGQNIGRPDDMQRALPKPTRSSFSVLSQAMPQSRIKFLIRPKRVNNG